MYLCQKKKKRISELKVLQVLKCNQIFLAYRKVMGGGGKLNPPLSFSSNTRRGQTREHVEHVACVDRTLFLGMNTSVAPDRMIWQKGCLYSLLLKGDYCIMGGGG